METGSIRDVSARITIDPKNTDLYLKRARLQSTYLNFAESAADASRAIAIKPTSAAYFTRGLAYRDMGDLPKAIADFEKAIALDPHSQNTFAELACLESKLHHYDKALHAYDQLFKLNPGRTVERSRRAEMYLQMHKPQEALKDINICLKTDLDRGGRCHEFAGLAYLQLKQYQKSIDAFSNTLSKSPYSVESRKGRAEAYEKLGKHDLAKRDLQELKNDFSDAYENAPFRNK